MTALAGLITLIFGLLITGAGVIGGVLEMMKDVKARPDAAGELSTSFLDALTKLTDALKDAPVWLARCIVGIVLIFVGAFLLYRAQPTE
jgi:hypothetical protein